MANNDANIVPVDLTQIVLFKIMALTGDIKHDIGIWVSILAVLLTKSKTIGVTQLPQKMSMEKAIDTYKNQMAGGLLSEDVMSMLALRDGSLQSFIDFDYYIKVVNLFIEVGTFLGEQGILDWQKIADTSGLMGMQGGGFQLISRR